MATKAEVEQALLDAIEGLAKRAEGQSGSNLAAGGEAVRHFTESWRFLRADSGGPVD